MSAPLVVATGLGKDFREGFRRRPNPALVSIDFTLDAGTIYGLLGPNGAGKSTTLHLLMGFIRPTRGSVTLFGRDPLDPESRRNVGFLPEVFSFDRFPTGTKLLRRFDALAGGDEAGSDHRVRDALAAVDLTSAAPRRVGSYSKGMTQRIGLAQAIVSDPDLLVLDEPMSGMDPATRHSTRGMLVARRERGKTTLLSSHILADIEALADRVLILDRGGLIAEGSLSELGRHDGGTLISFRAERPERFDGFLAELGVQRGSGDDESGVHQVAAQDTDSKNRLIARLVQDGADIVAVTPRTAGLERIFLELTGGSDPGAGR